MNWQEELTIGRGYTARDLSIEGHLTEWIEQHASADSILLAHLDDGVIWGYMNAGTLVTSDTADGRISPQLRHETLQQLFLFDANSEVRLWRIDSDFRAVQVKDAEDKNAASMDEKHLLWGTKATSQTEGFTLLEDGTQGLKHLPPSHIFHRDGIILQERIYLTVRHYLTPDTQGVNSISMSRLAGLGQLSHG